MEIKEVEKLLSVSRSNIRFYEKQGLLNPERSENNYRNYSENDIAVLKKIIVLRKLGFSVEEISSMQKGELLLSEAVTQNISRLENEIESLKGALEISKTLSAEKPSFDTLDEERLWNDITREEDKGKEFADICKDCIEIETSMFNNMWKYVFFHDFKKSKEKHGIPIAVGILLMLCLIRGISSVLLHDGSFWEGFFYPFELFALASLTVLPVYLLGLKAPKAAYIISTIILILGIGVIAFFVILLIYAVINTIFS